MDKIDRLHFFVTHSLTTKAVHTKDPVFSVNADKFLVKTKLNSRIPLFPLTFLVIKIPASRSCFQLASRVSPRKIAKSRIPPNLLWTLQRQSSRESFYHLSLLSPWIKTLWARISIYLQRPSFWKMLLNFFSKLCQK